jgi:hypothetical protein
MTMSKTIRTLVALTLVASVLQVNSNKIKLIDDFVCANSAKSILITLGGRIPTLDWTLGFWIRVDNVAGVNSPFMSFASSLSTIPLDFTIKTETATTFALYVGGVKNFVFTGADWVDDSEFQHIRRIAGNEWHYFTFAVKNFVTYVQIFRTADQQTGYSATSPLVYTTSNTNLVIGGTSSNIACSFSFRLHQLYLFDKAFGIIFGASFDQAKLLKFGGGFFIALYPMNINSSPRNFLNLLNLKTHKTIVENDIKKKTRLNFPTDIWGVFRINFSKYDITIKYPTSIFPKSPTDNSYTFFINYFIWKSASFDNTCWQEYVCYWIPTYSIQFYTRGKVGYSQYEIFSLIKQIDYSQSKVSILLRVGSQVMEFNPKAFFVNYSVSVGEQYSSASVRNNILMPKAVVTACYGNKNSKTCSSEYDLNTELRSDDIHQSIFPQAGSRYGEWGPTYNLFDFYVGEISFIEDSLLDYNAASRKLSNDNDYNYIIVFYANWATIQRLVSYSFDKLTFTSTSYQNYSVCGIGCAYCMGEKCLSCGNSYPRSLGSLYCVNDNGLYIRDELSLVEYPEFDMQSINILNNLTQIMDMMQKYVVNITFKDDPNFTNTIAFNSLENSNFNPYLRTYYTKKEKIYYRSMLVYMFQQVYDDFNKINKYLVRAFVKKINPKDYKINNPYAMMQEDLCFNDQLEYKTDPTGVSKCVRVCQLAFFNDITIPVCRYCPPDCTDCANYSLCLSCFNDCQLVEGECFCKDTWKQELMHHRVNFDPLAELSRRKGVIQVELILEQIVELLSLVSCPIARTNIKGSCPRCKDGCLSCTSDMKCNKCDANYQLTAAQICEFSFGVVALEKKRKIATEGGCLRCFQQRDVKSDGCATCETVCPCNMIANTVFYSYLLICSNSTLNGEYFAVPFSHKLYSQKRVGEEFALRILPKPRAVNFTYHMDLDLIGNSTQCSFEPTSDFPIVSGDLEWIARNFAISENLRLVLDFGIDALIITLCLFDAHVANVLIAFIQFNKTFLYVSMSNVKVGGVYDYVNFNVYQAKERQLGLFVDPHSPYEYLAQHIRMAGEKLATKYTVYTFLTLIAIAKLFMLFGKSHTFFEKKFEVEGWRDRFMHYYFKLVHVVTFKYFYVFVVSLNLFLRDLTLLKNEYHKCVWTVILLTLMYYPIYFRYRAFSFFRKTKVSSIAVFTTLRAPKRFALNQYIVKNRWGEELFVLAKTCSLYFLRKYPEGMLAAVLVVIILEMICLLFVLHIVNPTVTALKLLSLIFLFLFVVMLLLRMHEITAVPLLFNFVYVLANLFKFADGIADKLWAVFTNRADSQIVHPASRSSLEVVKLN